MKNLINRNCINKFVELRNGEHLKIIDIKSLTYNESLYSKSIITFDNGSTNVYWFDGTVSIYDNSPYDIIKILLLN